MFSANLIILVLLGQTPEPSSDPAALVEKLGSASYAEREAAKSLESLGAKALPPLRASLKSSDLEVRTRARALINKIEGNLLLQATTVRLDFKDATVEDIVKSLSKQAGFDVGVAQRGFNPVSGRITLQDPAPIPFWTAIDRICEAGQLTCEYQNPGPRRQGMPKPGLVLAFLMNSLPPTTNNVGPFHLNIESLLYSSQVSLRAAPRMSAPFRTSVRGVDVVPKKGANAAAKRVPAGTPTRAGTETADNAPVRTTQFQVQLRVVPEPRMLIGQTGAVEILEAVDDLGNSLLPGPNGDQRVNGPRGMMGTVMPGGTAAHLTAELHRPDTPGKVIKKLRGSVEVWVLAPRPNPLVIPLEGAVGKTFENGDRSVVVNAIDTDPARGQPRIELTPDDLNDLLPAHPVNGMVQGVRGGMMGGMVQGPGFGFNNSQAPIEVITSQGQNALFQTSVDRDSGRVTLNVNHAPQMGDLKEIHISSIVRARTKVAFEFHDLPMP
jgi:hypothetical protein